MASAYYKVYDARASQVPGIQFACELLNIPPHNAPQRLEPYHVRELNKQFTGLEFKTTHLGHRLKCGRIDSSKTAASYKFVAIFLIIHPVAE